MMMASQGRSSRSSHCRSCGQRGDYAHERILEVRAAQQGPVEPRDWSALPAVKTSPWGFWAGITCPVPCATTGTTAVTEGSSR